MDWRFAYLLAKLRTKKWEIPLASLLQTLSLRLYDSSKSLVFVGKQMPERPSEGQHVARSRRRAWKSHQDKIRKQPTRSEAWH